MKIIAVGRNYAAHIAELQNERPEEPIIFLKPDSAILRNNDPFFLPDFAQEFHHEVEIVLKICKNGKHIDPKFAYKYYEEIGLGIDFTARDLQDKLKKKGHPWELAKGFDGSAPISEFVPVSSFADIKKLAFSLKINGELKQSGNTNMMLFDFDYIISFVSKFFTLKIGDLIFTGTPPSVGAVKIEDHLEGFIENNMMLNFKVK